MREINGKLKEITGAPLTNHKTTIENVTTGYSYQSITIEKRGQTKELKVCLFGLAMPNVAKAQKAKHRKHWEEFQLFKNYLVFDGSIVKPSKPRPSNSVDTCK